MAEPRWSPGMFVWRELMTSDMDGARRFYGELFGWTWKAEDTGTGHAYWLASHAGRQLCGMMPIPPGTSCATSAERAAGAL